MSESFLDIGNVRAKIMNNGNLFWNGGQNVYEVPRGEGVHSIFSAGLWVGGLVKDELRTAGSTYGPYEFWPGPLEHANAPPESCTQYDRIWMVESDLHGPSHLSREKMASVAADWPADLGAPYDERNGVTGYQPDEGDVPMILGEQMAWWVMNDAGNSHERTNTAPLGIEVRAAAFAFDGPASLGNHTFYRYTILNRNDVSIDSLYVGMGMDADVGGAKDDLAATDTSSGMLYAFNGDNDDSQNYQSKPPALGFALIDLRLSEEPSRPAVPRFTNTLAWNNGGGVTGDPIDAEDYYNYLRSRWKDGIPQTFGRHGRNYSAERAHFIYPGDPVTESYWSPMNMDSTGRRESPADKKLVGSFGPLDFAPGDSLTFTVVVAWSRGDDFLDSVDRLRVTMEGLLSISEWLLTLRPVEFDEQATPEVPDRLSVALYPNPAVASARITLGLPRAMDVRIDVFDAVGRRVMDVVDMQLDASDRTWTIHTTDWAPGVYLVRIQLDHLTETRRLVVVR